MLKPIVLKSKFAKRNRSLRNINHHGPIIRQNLRHISKMNRIEDCEPNNVYQTFVEPSPSLCLTPLSITPRENCSREICIYQGIARNEVRERCSFPGIIKIVTSLMFFQRSNRIKVSQDNPWLINSNNLS